MDGRGTGSSTASLWWCCAGGGTAYAATVMAVQPESEKDEELGPAGESRAVAADMEKARRTRGDGESTTSGPRSTLTTERQVALCTALGQCGSPRPRAVAAIAAIAAVAGPSRSPHPRLEVGGGGGLAQGEGGERSVAGLRRGSRQGIGAHGAPTRFLLTLTSICEKPVYIHSARCIFSENSVFSERAGLYRTRIHMYSVCTSHCARIVGSTT